MTFLKSLWRKLFRKEVLIYQSEWRDVPAYIGKDITMTYDPSQDENRILKGEVESYFE